MQKQEFFEAITPKQTANKENAINVSSYGNKPHSQFSPFSYNKEFEIKVPGMKDKFSRSVEGIWQGLKVINGEIDESYFLKKAKKRPLGIYEGHLLGDSIIAIQEAREKIYKPAYFQYLEDYISTNLKEELFLKSIESKVYFYDVESNLDPNKKNALAHSVYLSKYMNKKLNSYIEIINKKINDAYNKKEFQHETLSEAITRIIKLKEEYNSTEFHKKLFTYAISTWNTKDKFEERFRNKIIELDL